MQELVVTVSQLPRVNLPRDYGYVAAFLTLRCNGSCSYCINRFSGSKLSLRAPEATAEQWIAGLNRLEMGTVPITIQGGEPSLHPGFYEIINGIRGDMPIDILTNLQFDINEFMRRVAPSRLRRDAPYASIRVSYHPGQPGQADLRSLIEKVSRLQDGGYSIGVWMVAHPDHADDLASAWSACQAAGIDFRTKEFLGWHGGKLHGTYRYPTAVSGVGEPSTTVMCRTSELLIGPDCAIYRCHSDLYAGTAGSTGFQPVSPGSTGFQPVSTWVGNPCYREPVGRLLDPKLAIDDIYRRCENFGLCNPCDVKIKTNRFQEYGHTSVDIRQTGGPGA